MFGLGTDKTVVTTTVTNATGSEVSTSGTLDLNLVSGLDEIFTVSIWFDNLFGTWAIQQLIPAQPVVSGDGAAPGEVVKLEVGGKVHVTVADSKGVFTFRAPNIEPGTGQLFVNGKAPANVEVKNLKLGVHESATLTTAPLKRS